MPELKLQYELPYQAFFVRWSKCAEHRQITIQNRIHIGFEIGVVLVMCSTDVPKGRHTNGEKIGALPEPVPVDKFGSFFIFNGCVGASYSITFLLQLSKSIINPSTLGYPIGHRSCQLP